MKNKRSLKRVFQAMWRGGRVDIPWIITEKNLEGAHVGDIFTAVRWCEGCREDQGLFDFLVRLRDGVIRGVEYQFLDIEGDGCKCHRHYPPVVLPLPDDSSTPFRIRLGALLDGMGHRMKLRDMKTGAALAPRHMGTRLVRVAPTQGDMTPKCIRQQPYGDRGADHEGNPYKGKGHRADPVAQI